MAGILKVDKYQDFNGNDIMTSDGSGNLTLNNAAMKMTPAFMAKLSTKIKEYCKANNVSDVDFTTDVLLQDDSNGQGAYIAEWNLDIAQPTDAQLASYETAANTAEANATVDATRKAAYGDIGEQLDEIYHDMEAWKTRIQGIKNNNPKS